jgi:hypothetical protein
MTPGPRNPKTIETLSCAILANPAPVLLLDTSSVLDIIRVGGRESCPPQLIEAAKEIVALASQSPPRLWIVTAELVQNEWNDHCGRVEIETRKRINELDRNIKGLTEVLRYLGSVPPVGVTVFSGHAIESQLTSLAASLLSAATIIQRDDGCSALANRRAIMCWAPASKGKDSVRDCTIIEHYISVCQQLVEAGFNSKCVFVSSNVNDYGKGGRPLPPLDEHFRVARIEYVTDLAWARSILLA